MRSRSRQALTGQHYLVTVVSLLIGSYPRRALRSGPTATEQRLAQGVTNAPIGPLPCPGRPIVAAAQKYVARATYAGDQGGVRER